MTSAQDCSRYEPAESASEGAGAVSATWSLPARPLRALCGFLALPVLALWSLATRGVHFASLVATLSEAGMGGCLHVALTGASVGGSFALQMTRPLEGYSAAHQILPYVPPMLAREIAPLLVSILAAAAIGSRIAAELAQMAVSNQIRAMLAFELDPIALLVAPRLLGLALAVPALTLLFDFCAIAAAYAIAYGHYVDPAEFLRPLLAQPEHIGCGLSKSLIYGVLVAVIGCHVGLSTDPESGAAGAARSATRAVVLTVVTVLLLDYPLGRMFAPAAQP